MARYRFVPYDKMVASFARVFKMNNNEWMSESAEVVGEFIDLIGGDKIYKKVYKFVTIHNHRAEYPCDLKYLITITHNGCKVDVSSAFNHESNNIPGGLRTGTYSHQDNYLYVPTKSGKVKFTYYKYVVDEKGMPLIPDNTKFIIGLRWYMLYTLLLGGYTHPTINLEYAQLMHIRTLGQAKNSIKFPAPDEVQEMVLNNSLMIFDSLEDKTFNEY